MDLEKERRSVVHAQLVRAGEVRLGYIANRLTDEVLDGALGFVVAVPLERSSAARTRARSADDVKGLGKNSTPASSTP